MLEAAAVSTQLKIQQAELEALQEELAERKSTLHFAHTGVSLIVALLFASAAAKLFWDSVKLPYLGIASALVAIGLAGYALSQYRKGRKTLAWELERFERLKSLRGELGLDDAASLLPSA